MPPFPTSAPPILVDDALSRAGDGSARLTLRLPWIRSLPLRSLGDLRLELDGEAVQLTALVTPDAVVPADATATNESWWFLQDPLELRTASPLPPGEHAVSVAFRLLVPYLPGGPGTPLVLPFRATRTLSTTGATPAPAARVARTDAHSGSSTATGWSFAASAFNWTPEIMRGERDAADIVHAIVADGVADVVELEPGQTWRAFPDPPEVEVAALRDRLSAAGGRVSIVGACLDDWFDERTRRDDAARLAFLLPQLRLAKTVGATGVRLPIGQAGPALLSALVPHLHEFELTLYEEIQGPQSPASAPVRAAVDAIADLGDPRVRLLLDCSMLMPSLPPSYLETLRARGVEPALLDRLETAWLDDETPLAVAEALREGRVPPAAHTLFMDLVVRFGRSQVSDIVDLLPLVDAFHLKFWDLDDGDGRISAPLRALGAALRAQGFTGTLCSEWGGHGWISDADPADMTRRHLAMAADALGDAP